MPGQINIDSFFGKIIYHLCKNENFKTYCEVGSWNGEGSTLCILKAILDKENHEDNVFYSIEANKEMHQQALKYHQNYHYKTPLKLLYGKVNNKFILSENEILNHPAFYKVKDHYYIHYNDECNSFINSPYIGDEIKENNIDVVLLDGGEFSTDGDFDFFKDRNVKLFILDDVSIIKCSNIRKQLLNDERYKLYMEDLNDRNGWSIFQLK